MSNDYIVDIGNVSSDMFNRLVEKAISIATEYIGDTAAYNNVVRQVIHAFAGTAEGVAYSLVVVFFLIGVLKNCISFQDLKRPETVFGLFLRLTFAVWLVDNAYAISTDIYKICQGLGDKLLYAFGWSGASYNIAGGYFDSDMEEAVMELSFNEGLPVFAIVLIGAMLSIVLGVVILYTIIGRLWRIATILCFSPLCFAAFAGEPSQSFTRNYLKVLIAYSLEVIVFFIAFRLYQALGDSSTISGYGWTVVGDILYELTKMILYQLVLCGMIKGADRITERVIA